MSQPIRVVLAKMGLDCHDTAVVALARELRDAGMEVIYLGLHNSARKVAAVAEQEDPDVIGLSFLSGQQLPQTRQLVAELRRRGIEDVMLLVGGVIPKDHIAALKELGVDEVFTPGTMMSEIVSYIHEHASREPVAQ
ncbi:MAG: cobalamin-dependent protein [Solirubrobacterales bacterium]|nr:cobalamin-dependent protein [Solirubrobacterales bacterium]MBV9941675.1 cobalamin-dependent protein [Solirubrobacterales bacterium]